ARSHHLAGRGGLRRRGSAAQPVRPARPGGHLALGRVERRLATGVAAPHGRAVPVPRRRARRQLHRRQRAGRRAARERRGRPARGVAGAAHRSGRAVLGAAPCGAARGRL
ncbi:MAG: hypothetical protein AVDCRST_MAG07-2563, partial [uncultured Frankineae bacterium]